ncbi:MAG: serine--tRNA ligase, partial [Patescibacteria group bacterium]
MLDIKFIKENADLIKEAARKKHIKFDVDGLLQIDETRLETLSLVENLRAEQNKISDKVAGIKDATEREALIKEMRVLKERLKQKEDELKEILKKW